MKLIMITRKVDQADARAGFTYGWVKELARNLEHLWVVTWHESAGTGLPSNVTLIPVSGSRLRKSLELMRHLFRFAKQADGIFCHMNPEYALLAAPAAHWSKRRMVVWYTHKAISWRRRLMELVADGIITASAESFRRPWFPAKVQVVGHGIDTEVFKPSPREGFDRFFRILTVGRVSPTKHVGTMIEAAGLLKDMDVHFDIVGDAVFPSDVNRRRELEQQVREGRLESTVRFLGWVPHDKTVPYYQSADVFINLSETGSLDKAGLEAMACGCIMVTSNEAFKNMLGPKEYLTDSSAQALAEAIRRVAHYGPDEKLAITSRMRKFVEEQHGLIRCMERIVSQFR